jgi:hypothetical protein|tara:strand:- start:125 stop:319 length:195 start_codon:yes stop_codon:yes gene_type:complete
MKKLLILLLTSILTLTAQTYTVGDTVDNFGATVCVNDSGFEDGYWDYNTDGLHKIVWMNLFTSW